MRSFGVTVGLHQLNDKELAQRLVTGENDAYTLLMERHRTALLHIVRRILGRETDGEDITQETFLTAFRRMAQYDPQRGSLFGWLKQIAISRALDQRKRFKSLEASHEKEFDESVLLKSQSTFQEDVYAVDEAMAKLKPAHRAALVLHYFGGFTAEEIAEQTGKSISVIHHRLHEARRKLKYLLTEPVTTR